MKNSLLKRCFDISISLLLLAVFSPMILTLVFLIRVNMGSPVLFKQKRPGLNGKPFNILKFRTMNSATDSEGRLLPDELRLTRLGKFLRATSLDELPELLNVINGKMSLVGPRPLRMHYMERYTPKQARRHEVRPGITGWAQVNGRNAISWEERFLLDEWYVDNNTFFLDVKILWLTLIKVIKREGISAEGFATMPEFMGTKQKNSSY